MDIIDDKEKLITSIEDWKNYMFRRKKEKDWHQGKSAMSLAQYVMEFGGEEEIKILLKKLVNEEVILLKAIPEFEVSFDEFSHGREHDLAIYAITARSSRTIFVGVEAKVNETFGNTIGKEYLKAKSEKLSGSNTRKDERIEKLLQQHFKEINPHIFKLRYQLLYATMGTVMAAYEKDRADIYILLILSFKTALYNEKKGAQNYQDFLSFIKEMRGEPIANDPSLDAWMMKVNDYPLIIAHRYIS
jgi:hypothetical protein